MTLWWAREFIKIVEEWNAREEGTNTDSWLTFIQPLIIEERIVHYDEDNIPERIEYLPGMFIESDYLQKKVFSPQDEYGNRQIPLEQEMEPPRLHNTDQQDQVEEMRRFTHQPDQPSNPEPTLRGGRTWY